VSHYSSSYRRPAMLAITTPAPPDAITRANSSSITAHSEQVDANDGLGRRLHARESGRVRYLGDAAGPRGGVGQLRHRRLIQHVHTRWVPAGLRLKQVTTPGTSSDIEILSM
jgi:hypothetical protein